MTRPSYGVFDADNHYYEPRDAILRYIDPRRRDKAVRTERDPDGSEHVYIGRKRFTFLDDMELNFETTLRPGSLREFLRTLTKEIPEESAVRCPVEPAMYDRAARLALMDAQGIESAFLFPTLGVCLEQYMKDDPEQMYANLRALHRWVDQEWGFSYKDRIFSPPIVSLLDVERACEELDWCLARGARMISLRPGPAFGRSQADPHYDPFWARANEAELLVCYHVGDSGYNEMMAPYWGTAPNPTSHGQSAFQWVSFYGDRPIMDTVSSLILWNLFGRFPKLKVLSIENGSLWVPYLLKQMDKMKGMGRNGPWPGGRAAGRPSEIFKRHFWVNPYHEEDHAALADLIGADRVCFGSDYPHPEGLEDPAAWYGEERGRFSEADLKNILRDNARRLVGLPV